MNNRKKKKKKNSYLPLFPAEPCCPQAFESPWPRMKIKAANRINYYKWITPVTVAELTLSTPAPHH